MKFFFLLLPIFAFSQPKGANVIKVSGVAFREVANALLDAGYSFEKIDSNFQTIRTEYRTFTGYIPKIRLEIRVKDSTATFKGTWISMDMLFDIENLKSPANKFTFSKMNDLALSFNKPVEYLKQ